jgi:hypothetical protein
MIIKVDRPRVRHPRNPGSFLERKINFSFVRNAEASPGAHPAA